MLLVVRVGLLCRIGTVCLPSVLWAETIETKPLVLDVLDLWENHGIHIVCLFHWARALAWRGEGSACYGCVGAYCVQDWLGLVCHGGILPDVHLS